MHVGFDIHDFFSREEALARSRLLEQGEISREAVRSTNQGAPAFFSFF